MIKNADIFGWGPKNKMADYKLKELLPLVSGNRTLDIGCGPGTFVNNLTEKGFDATGVDLIAKFIVFARKNYQGKFLIADAYKLPFENKSFDTVFIRSVLEHLDNDLKALKEAVRVGRKIVVIVPQTTPDNLRQKGLIYSHYQDISHLRTYTPTTLKKLISQTSGALIEIISSEPLPTKSVIFELISGFKFIKRIGIKLLFMFFKPQKYYLELIAIIKSN